MFLRRFILVVDIFIEIKNKKFYFKSLENPKFESNFN